MWVALRFGDFEPTYAASNDTWTVSDQILRLFLEYKLLDILAHATGIHGRPPTIPASPLWLRFLKREATGKKVRWRC